ncbi:hypothetical protein CONPUDRAFT_155623 [Coniophora puteana RWD-64-598 SS2]|uniref:Transmembrane protein n=1 Tax=Coniophora puteana (strain RWD-64-598) TaxID=741705 RepID=A0A5M3MIJ5_CONPW|nr:uncharacterized protein CONPUDRAFT_155623 [Coniophora puteana RWD-64-598 SS2]EIW78923.1 hypothetical protein CONPUDRAFT_155623 [Coniophora puteana RWD-64-598 SS2]
MFIIASTHLAADFARVINAFIQVSTTEEQLDVLNATTAVAYMIKTTAYMVQTVWVGDGFMVYRVYKVWNGDKRIVIPICIALVGSMATSLGALHASGTNHGDVFEIRNWAFATFSMTLGVNFSGTALIAGRIIWNERQFREMTVQGRNTMSAAVIIIESGAIYSAGTIGLLACFGLNSFYAYVFQDSLMPVVGIVFSLIIVRIGLGMSTMTTYHTTTRRQVLIPSSNQQANNAPPLAINVSKMTHTDAGSGYLKERGIDHTSTSEEGLELSPTKRHSVSA